MDTGIIVSSFGVVSFAAVLFTAISFSAVAFSAVAFSAVAFSAVCTGVYAEASPTRKIMKNIIALIISHPKFAFKLLSCVV